MFAKGVHNIFKLTKEISVFHKFCTNKIPRILFSTAPSNKVTKSESSRTLPSTSVSIKVKEGVKDASYSLIVIGGVLFTGMGFYYVFRELFSFDSPQGVYDQTFKLCSKDNNVINMIGGNIKGYGETDRRGRRRHAANLEWLDSAKKKHMSMKFYLEGTLGKATVFLEVEKDDNNKYQYKYVLVETSNYPQRQFFLVDNRR